MTTNDGLTYFGILLTVMGLVVSIRYGRKSLKPPKRSLEWSASSIPLLSRNYADVEVLVRKRQITEPHLLTLQLRNTGRIDIDSASFDQARPLSFSILTTDFVYLLKPDSHVDIDAHHDGVAIGPDLLAAGGSWSFSLITEGPTGVSLLEHYLRDTNVTRRYIPTGAQASDTKLAMFWAIFGLVAAVAGIIVSVLVNVHP